MTRALDLSGFDRLRDRLLNVVNPDAAPLMVSWMKTIHDDNRRGVLAGLDKDGRPMVPVTYRPRPTAQKRLTAAQRNNPRKGARTGAFAGLGAHPAGTNNNLTSAEYRRLAGPPLAPRGAFSRVITNLQLRFGRIDSHHWEAVGYWDEVVSTQGLPFLHYHFDGATGGGRNRNVTLPKRDLRGVRQWGRDKVRRSLRAWMIDVIRGA